MGLTEGAPVNYQNRTLTANLTGGDGGWFAERSGDGLGNLTNIKQFGFVVVADGPRSTFGRFYTNTDIKSLLNQISGLNPTPDLPSWSNPNVNIYVDAKRNGVESQLSVSGINNGQLQGFGITFGVENLIKSLGAYPWCRRFYVLGDITFEQYRDFVIFLYTVHKITTVTTEDDPAAVKAELDAMLTAAEITLVQYDDFVSAWGIADLVPSWENI